MKIIRILIMLGLSLGPIAIGVAPQTVLAAHGDSFQQGYDEGFPQGYRRGYHDGSEGRRNHYHPADGYDAYTRGLHDGRHDGYVEGFRDGRRGDEARY